MPQDNILKINQGDIVVYRVFDIGSEVNIAHAETILENHQTLKTINFKKSSKTIILAEQPLSMVLPSWDEKILDETVRVSGMAKIWSFGALSVKILIPIKPNSSMEDLYPIANYLENNEDFHKSIVNHVENILKMLGEAIHFPKLWDQYEDYIIYKIDSLETIEQNIQKMFINKSTVALILAERPINYSQDIIDSLEENISQYSADDFILIHWNGAIIKSDEDANELSDVVEFAICQLIELRYYDDLLDKQLKILYKKIEKQQQGIFTNPYSKLAKQAFLQYIDISELVDRITSSVKVTGDFYYGKIYRKAISQFHLKEWRQSVGSKLNNLAEISKLYHGEINERKNLVMEAVIVLLITIEVFQLMVDNIFGR